MRGFLVLFLLAQLLSGCVTMTQIRLDAEVDRRCREDGGLKVYETIPTPPEMFDESGTFKGFDANIPQDVNALKAGYRFHENALGPNYRFIYKKTFYYGGYLPLSKYSLHVSPSMWQVHIQIFRRSDNKLLGESIGYRRYGGDPGWTTTLSSGAPESSYWCPESGVESNSLINAIFINTAKRGGNP